MSRIGKQPIDLPNGVKAAVNGQVVNVEGPKGKLSLNAHAQMNVSIKENQVLVERATEGREARSYTV